MFIHHATCPVWAAGRCTCPRVWRIRKDRTPGTARERFYCWRILRRDDQGDYAPVMRTHEMQRALDLVDALTGIADRYRMASSFRGRI